MSSYFSEVLWVVRDLSFGPIAGCLQAHGATLPLTVTTLLDYAGSTE